MEERNPITEVLVSSDYFSCCRVEFVYLVASKSGLLFPSRQLIVDTCVHCCEGFFAPQIPCISYPIVPESI
ncbi:unnamed protein product [Amaranthus hypochondriacus]